MPRSHLTLLTTILLLYLSSFLFTGRWQSMFYYGDTNGYYLHVVSFLLYGDVGDYSESIGSLLEYYPDADDPRTDKYGIRTTGTGRQYIKYTLGTPLMEAPFFGIAHFMASISSTYAANGWSPPYTFMVGLSTLSYLMLGFAMLLRLLARYFSPTISLLAVGTIALGTNLFYHGTFMAMSHGFLFFDYCVLLFLSDRFYESPRRWKALLIGATVGLITLTRVPEVISLLLPLLWGVDSRNALTERLRFLFLERRDLLALAAIALLAVFSLQLGYWYYVSGQLVFNPYDGEGFNFLNPKIHKGWFDFENGWLVYTPVMGLSLIGLFYLPRFTRGKVLPIALFVFLQAYIHYSYYVWNYFPGFGSRPMIETYPALAFGLASVIALLSRARWTAVVLGLLLTGFTLLNLFQTWQMHKGIIWSERGSVAFFLETFGQLSPSRPALIAFDTKERQPDSSKLILVDTIWQQDFEDLQYKDPPATPAYSGQQAYLTRAGNDTLLQAFTLPRVAAGDYVHLSVQGYIRPEDQIWNRGQAAMLVLAFLDNNGERLKRHFFKPSSHIGNTDHNIWSAGVPGQWGQAAFFTRIPHKAEDIRIEIRNPYQQQFFLDELLVIHYRHP